MRLLLVIDWSIFERRYLGETVAAYLWFTGIIVGTLLLKKPLAAVLTRISSNLAARYSYMKHRDTIRPMLFKPIEALLQIVLYYIAVNQLDHLLERVSLRRLLHKPGRINFNLQDVADHVFLFLFIIFLTRVVSRFIDFVYYLRMGKAQMDENNSREQLLPLLKEMSKLVLWAFSVFWILGSVFHVNIPALITGLGIGGVAIALAGKATVENFFAAFTILSDRPFLVGDTIKLGDIEGVVERIGFRSTRVRNLDGSAFIIPNQNLVSQNLVNLSMRTTRGMKLALHIRHGSIEHRTFTVLAEEIKTELRATQYVTEPIDVILEAFDKETFQVTVSYQLPHPLPDGLRLNAVKRDINLKIYTLVSSRAALGVPPGGN